MNIAKPFHDGLKENRLLLPWCKACGKPHFYPRSACPHCWGEEYDWREAAGTGVIHTCTVVRNNPPPAWVSRLPYAIAIIDLDEGVRLLSNIVDDFEEMEIGDPVALQFITRDGENQPLFRRVK